MTDPQTYQTSGKADWWCVECKRFVSVGSHKHDIEYGDFVALDTKRIVETRKPTPDMKVPPEVHVNDRMIDEFMARFGYRWNDAQDFYENRTKGLEVPGDFASEMSKHFATIEHYYHSQTEKVLREVIGTHEWEELTGKNADVRRKGRNELRGLITKRAAERGYQLNEEKAE